MKYNTMKLLEDIKTFTDEYDNMNIPSLISYIEGIVETCAQWDIKYSALKYDCKIIGRALSQYSNRMLELVKRKGEDYQSEEVEREDYFPFGTKSYLQMIWVKALRVRSLGDSPNFESRDDSLIDLLAYTCFFYDWLCKMERPHCK